MSAVRAGRRRTRGSGCQTPAWRRSDELRAEIQRLGWLVEDTPGGPRLTRKSG